MKYQLNQVYNEDCVQAMKQMPDNYFDLAIVDPPYGIARFGNREEVSNRIGSNAKINTWDTKPTAEYFSELRRVSQIQIIWGANNFTLPETEYFIVWDKKQTVDNFASAEYAWTNSKTPAKVFRYSIHKTMQDRKKGGGKIHPTQKPVQLYRWLLDNYAKPDMKILDTHLGSASSVLAMIDYGCDWMAFETDKEYYDNALKRINGHIRKPKIDFEQTGKVYTQLKIE